MATYRFSKHVNAPQQTVFNAATDLEMWPEYIRGIESVEKLTEGPLAVGTRFRETRRMFGTMATEEMRFIAMEPPRSFALEAESCGMRIVTEQTFRPDIPGTFVEMVVNTQPLSFLARLMTPLAWLMSGAMKKAIAEDLDDLKAAAEQRAPEDWHVRDGAGSYEFERA